MEIGLPYVHAPRFFINSDEIRQLPQGWALTVIGEDAHHAIKVLRLKEGDTLILVDEEANEYLAVVSQIDLAGDGPGPMLVATAEEVRPSQAEPPFPITLIQALPKGDKFDDVVQKGTEVGITQFVPALSERVIVKLSRDKEKARINRWQRIAMEAAKQSGRGRVPGVHGLLDIMEAAKVEIDRGSLVLFFWERATVPLKEQLREQLRRAQSEAGAAGEHGSEGWKRPVSIIIGPEGGFSEEEADCFAQMGCITVSMGPRLLRTETAGPVAAALVLYELSD